MENGIDNVLRSHEEEMERRGDGISEDRKAGSDESQELEGDDVFEEAMDLKDVRRNQNVDAVVGKDSDVDEVSLLPTRLSNENHESEQEVDNFVEAIEIPAESGQAEGEKATVDELNLHQGVNNIFHKDGVDSGGTENGVENDESNGVKGDGLVGREHDDGKELPVYDTSRQREVSEDGENVDVNRKREIQGSENVTSENLILVQTTVDGKPGDAHTDSAVGSVSDSLLEAESHEKMVNEEAIVEESKEDNAEEMVNEEAIVEESKEDNAETEFKHQGIEEQSSALLHDSNGKVTSDSLTCISNHVHEDEVRDLKDGQVVIEKSNQDISENESGEESNHLTAKHDDKPNRKVDVSKVELELERDGKFGKLEGTAPVIHTSFNGSVLATDTRTSSIENVAFDNSSQRAAPPNLELENGKGESLKPNDNEVHGDHNNIVEALENETLQGKSGREKQTSPVRQQDVQPAVNLTAAKSASSTPPTSRPAGLGRAAPLLEPAQRVVQQPRANGTVSQTQAQQVEDPTNVEAEEHDETREKLQMIRVKFLRLAHRLGQTPHNVVVAQVLYRLGLAEQLRGRNGGRVGAFSFDRASAMAEQLEAAGQEPLDFSCTIMVLGKSGVGKSATINSIFDEVKFCTDAFQMGTKNVQDVIGTVQGIKVRVIDTPGLLPSWSDQSHNEKILHSVKRFIKRTPPDIVLYLDRLDVQNRDLSDMPLLRTITDIFGPSIWFNAIVVLTHAASAPPDGPNGTASSYDMFVTQRSHVVQQAIRQAAGDMRLMNPVSLVENHSACRTNRAGQRVLPNGQVWKPHLLLLSFASKILAEANALLKLQDSPPGKPFTARSRAPPLPFLLSSLLQSRPQLKLPEDQFGDEDGLDDDLDESSDSDNEQELDELPPFRPLTKAQMDKLSKSQRKAYFDELDYREKLFMRKQLKEEKKRRRLTKKMEASVKGLPDEFKENAEEESAGAASVPVPMPDLALPASFDSDNPTHRYRYLDSSNQWLVRPVLDSHGWDHDVGYEGINVERLFVVKEKLPLSFSGQMTKDKKDASVQMEVASSIKHGEGKATTVGFDMQSVGKDLAYTLRSETIFSNIWRNKATAGLSVTLLGDALSAGVKVEDKLIANKQFKLVVTGGAMTGRGDIAYGGSLEAQLRDKDYPLGHSLSTLGLSVMDWHGDLAIGCNIQSQVPIGRSTNLIARANLNNRGSGQVSVRVNSSEQLQIALIGFLPLLKKLVGYSQLQFGQG